MPVYTAGVRHTAELEKPGGTLEVTEIKGLRRKLGGIFHARAGNRGFGAPEILHDLSGLGLF